MYLSHLGRKHLWITLLSPICSLLCPIKTSGQRGSFRFRSTASLSAWWHPWSACSEVVVEVPNLCGFFPVSASLPDPHSPSPPTPDWGMRFWLQLGMVQNLKNLFECFTKTIYSTASGKGMNSRKSQSKKKQTGKNEMEIKQRPKKWGVEARPITTRIVNGEDSFVKRQSLSRQSLKYLRQRNCLSSVKICFGCKDTGRLKFKRME